MEYIRSLITRIELTPREGGGVTAELHGDLAQIDAILERAQTPKARRMTGGLSGLVSTVLLVAGARYHLRRTGRVG